MYKHKLFKLIKSFFFNNLEKIRLILKDKKICIVFVIIRY